MYSIYKATHTPTGKVYVGQTKRKLELRIGQHWAEYRAMRKFNLFLQSTKMNEWTWEVIRVVDSYKEARDCELYYIEKWNLYEEGLNMRTGAKFNAAAREAASKRFREYKEKNPEPWNKGRTGVYSEKTRELMSLAKQINPSRVVYTEESKLAASLAQKNSKSIVEVGTDNVYRSISDAARKTGLRREAIRDVVKGRRSHTGGRVFKLV